MISFNQSPVYISGGTSSSSTKSASLLRCTCGTAVWVCFLLLSCTILAKSMDFGASLTYNECSIRASFNMRYGWVWSYLEQFALWDLRWLLRCRLFLWFRLRFRYFSYNWRSLRWLIIIINNSDVVATDIDPTLGIVMSRCPVVSDLFAELESYNIIQQSSHENPPDQQRYY